jgi:hypothetical protein
MTFLIKLICGNQIKNAITRLEDGQGIDVSSLKTSNLNIAVNAVFAECHWKTSHLNSYKKEAIKSILRDRVRANKADNLGYLVLAACDKTADDSTCRNLQVKFPSFDRYEIRYIIKHNKTILEYLKKLSKKTGATFLNFLDSTDEKERISIFDNIHNDAKKEFYENKGHFDYLTKTLCKRMAKIGMKESDIDRSVYLRLFQEEPMASPQQIRRILDEVDPRDRNRVLKTLIDDAKEILSE